MENLRVLGTTVIVGAMQSGERIVKKIVIADDNGTQHGIHPRWSQVKYLGEEVTDLKVGDWVLVDHGRWTREINSDLEGEELRVIEYPQSVRMVSDVEPEDNMLNDSTEFGRAYNV